MQNSGLRLVSAQKNARGTAYCDEAERLLHSLAHCIGHLSVLHSHHCEAVIEGDPESDRFDDLIYIANQEKNLAKYTYLEHLRLHGCSTFPTDPESEEER